MRSWLYPLIQIYNYLIDEIIDAGIESSDAPIKIIKIEKKSRIFRWKKIISIDDLNQIVKQVLKTNQKTILFVIYNSQNQRRYIGVKLDQ